jgi:hypothetical protein
VITTLPKGAPLVAHHKRGVPLDIEDYKTIAEHASSKGHVLVIEVYPVRA